MAFISSISFKILLPIILLALQIALKFFVGRKPTVPNFVAALLEVPVSIIFTSLSLIAGFLIAGNGNAQQLFIYFLGILIFAVIAVFLWRLSIDKFDNEKFLSAIFLGGVNIAISLPVLYYVVNFLAQANIKAIC
jgi:hypothetical protein